MNENTGFLLKPPQIDSTMTYVQAEYSYDDIYEKILERVEICQGQGVNFINTIEFSQLYSIIYDIVDSVNTDPGDVVAVMLLFMRGEKEAASRKLATLVHNTFKSYPKGF